MPTSTFSSVFVLFLFVRGIICERITVSGDWLSGLRTADSAAAVAAEAEALEASLEGVSRFPSFDTSGGVGDFWELSHGRASQQEHQHLLGNRFAHPESSGAEHGFGRRNAVDDELWHLVGNRGVSPPSLSGGPRGPDDIVGVSREAASFLKPTTLLVDAHNGNAGNGAVSALPQLNTIGNRNAARKALLDNNIADGVASEFGRRAGSFSVKPAEEAAVGAAVSAAAAEERSADAVGFVAALAAYDQDKFRKTRGEGPAGRAAEAASRAEASAIMAAQWATAVQKSRDNHTPSEADAAASAANTTRPIAASRLERPPCRDGPPLVAEQTKILDGSRAREYDEDVAAARARSWSNGGGPIREANFDDNINGRSVTMPSAVGAQPAGENKLEASAVAPARPFPMNAQPVGPSRLSVPTYASNSGHQSANTKVLPYPFLEPVPALDGGRERATRNTSERSSEKAFDDGLERQQKEDMLRYLSAYGAQPAAETKLRRPYMGDSHARPAPPAVETMSAKKDAKPFVETVFANQAPDRFLENARASAAQPAVEPMFAREGREHFSDGNHDQGSGPGFVTNFAKEGREPYLVGHRATSTQHVVEARSGSEVREPNLDDIRAKRTQPAVEPMSTKGGRTPYPDSISEKKGRMPGFDDSRLEQILQRKIESELSPEEVNILRHDIASRQLNGLVQADRLALQRPRRLREHRAPRQRRVVPRLHHGMRRIKQWRRKPIRQRATLLADSVRRDLEERELQMPRRRLMKIGKVSTVQSAVAQQSKSTDREAEEEDDQKERKEEKEREKTENEQEQEKGRKIEKDEEIEEENDDEEDEEEDEEEEEEQEEENNDADADDQPSDEPLKGHMSFGD
eukprot:TRINITY_DN13748_c0_g1_i1.p1 TRINITY_DN13748_c0_g1~~TRINITY_DN13748_c0_g1_i1.p1  ORF type:complete len:861 (+),score=152.90 TRINITY_DN13748_c0_g1_i1:91-2673(+)